MDTPLPFLVTVFVIVLGPFKLIAPFVRATANADPALTRKIARRAFAWATVTAFVIVGLGGYLMSRLELSNGAVWVTMGFFLAHWAVRNAVAEEGQGPPTSAEPSLQLAVFPVALPGIIPPHGIALLVLAGDLQIESGLVDDLLLYGLILSVMGLNWLCMVGAGRLMRFPGPVPLAIASRVVAVILSASAVQVILRGLRALEIVV